jgi:DNA-directed RNA polymerase specialized sigma24 family protein
MAGAEPKPSLVERLFAEHRGALQSFFLRRIRAKADAADPAQEVYVRMLHGNREGPTECREDQDSAYQVPRPAPWRTR